MDAYEILGEPGTHDADVIWGTDSEAESTIIVKHMGRIVLISREYEEIVHDTQGFEGVSNYYANTYIIGRECSLARGVLTLAKSKAESQDNAG